MRYTRAQIEKYHQLLNLCEEGDFCGVVMLVRDKQTPTFIRGAAELSPLAIAAEKADAGMIRVLLKNGAKANTSFSCMHNPIDILLEKLQYHPQLMRKIRFCKSLELLIDNGAQTNLFTAAMFGRMDIIKPVLDFFPNSLHAQGPHGYTLLHHAQRGGEEAKEVETYLKSLGAKETKIKLY